MKYQLLATVALLATGLTVAAPAQATSIITFDGYGSSAPGPNSGVDAQGNPWLWNKTGLGYSAWGAPGLGAGTSKFNTSTGYVAEDFAVSFVDFAGGSINTALSPSPSGSNEFTRFSSYVGGVWYAWTPVYDGTKNVTFTAPTVAAWLHNGDQYFVNIVFKEKDLTGHNVGFTAAFSAAVPEMSTWAMLIAGFAGLGLVGLGRNKKAPEISEWENPTGVISRHGLVQFINQAEPTGTYDWQSNSLLNCQVCSRWPLKILWRCLFRV
jgi:hypothetical protein